MERVFGRGKWIWVSPTGGEDTYGEFRGRFVWKGGSTRCRFSCDGDYTLFLNGAYVASNQYGDYEHYKIYDEIDLTPHLRAGENEFFALVWHFGRDSQRYIRASAGVIFSVEEEGIPLLVSDEGILCRLSECYRNGYAKEITSQMGFSFLYDATREGAGEFHPAVAVEKSCTFYPRPIRKLQLLPAVWGTVLQNDGKHCLLDLGGETVGLPTLSLISDTEQLITVAWGENLRNGHVAKRIGRRDFSFEYVAKIGENHYTNYMLRLGCRYLELFSEQPIQLRALGLIPQIYPVEESTCRAEDPKDQPIYDICVNTLKLSMMEHYVDTPWREQCLYAFDSRNQILCGYRAFADGNVDYARANLLLMSQDRRKDGLLAICYPCGADLTIPSFSLYYFTAIREYLDQTGDHSLVDEVYPKLISLVETFLDNRRNGLVNRFEGIHHWNFYDWSPHLSGKLGKEDDAIPDLMLNCLFILALEHLQRIDLATGRAFRYSHVLEEARSCTRRAFYNEARGAFSLTENGEEWTVLGNAMAILAGLSEDSDRICRGFAEGEFSDCSLSMKCFQYDAMLQTDKEKWRPFVLSEIRKCYGDMLAAGSQTVWETMGGYTDFGNAGSLCHGWSAIPICYL